MSMRVCVPEEEAEEVVVEVVAGEEVLAVEDIMIDLVVVVHVMKEGK